MCEVGLEKDRWPLPPARKCPDSGYGLFFAVVDFLALDCKGPWLFLPEVLGVSEDEEFLRFASRFIHAANGRLRVCRSFAMKISKTIRIRRENGGEKGANDGRIGGCEKKQSSWRKEERQAYHVVWQQAPR